MSIIKHLIHIFLCIGLANATTIMPLSIEQRAAKADRVVLATVDEISTVASTDGKRLFTITHLLVQKSLKGTAIPNMRLTVRQIGGTLGEFTQYIPGDAKFNQDEEVLVFLRHDPADDLHFLVGMGQGKISVNFDTDEAYVDSPSSTNPHSKTFAQAPKPNVVKPSLSSLMETIARSLTPRSQSPLP